jgi:serine/threonine-protein kinase
MLCESPDELLGGRRTTAAIIDENIQRLRPRRAVEFEVQTDLLYVELGRLEGGNRHGVHLTGRADDPDGRPGSARFAGVDRPFLVRCAFHVSHRLRPRDPILPQDVSEIPMVAQHQRGGMHGIQDQCRPSVTAAVKWLDDVAEGTRIHAVRAAVWRHVAASVPMGVISMGELPPGLETRRADVVFGQIAVARHFVSPQQVRECTNELTRKLKTSPDLSLADVLVKRGYLTKNQRDTIQTFADQQMGPERIGRYELVQKIGEGGMGAVYRARDSTTDRVVALKVLPPHMAQDKVFMGRFQREALAVTRLEHPNIVRGLDVGTADGAQYIAMEFVDGQDCDKMLSRRGRIPEKEAVRIAVQMTRALQYAATKRLVHRDIKPANILVMQDGTAKLTDLGLAKSTAATAAKLTQTGITMGTPHYISPEQAMGSSDLDVRSDIYSLGATLYHLVTGRVPFEGSSPAVIVAKHLTEELTNPKDIVPEVSQGLVRVLEKMLAKDRDDRYSDPGQLVADLERLLEDREPDTQGLAPGRSAIMKAADFRKVADRLSSKKQAVPQGRKSPVMLVVGVLLGLAIAVGVVVLLIRQDPSMVDKLVHSFPGRGGDTAIFDGRSLDGWTTSGAERTWQVATGGVVHSPAGGEGQLESVKTFSDYRLHVEYRADGASEAYLVFSKPPRSRGGRRLRLTGTGEKWGVVELRVSGTDFSATIDGKSASPDSAGAVAKGTIAFDVKRGPLEIRNARISKNQATASDGT